MKGYSTIKVKFFLEHPRPRKNKIFPQVCQLLHVKIFQILRLNKPRSAHLTLSGVESTFESHFEQATAENLNNR